MASITSKLVLDASGFTKGIKTAQSSLSKFQASAGPAVMGGIAAGFAAAAAAAAGLAVGIKKAIDIGGALSELSARTGVAAGELRVLQMAFERAGMSADQVGPAVNRMQRAIVEASTGSKEAQQAFSNIGLSLDSIRNLSPEQQFEAIGQAIAGLKDPAAQAAATMQIFGRGAGNLLAIFKDSGALGDAASAIGAQAEILTRNANLFDRASDILNTIGSKLEGFFVGVADQVVPAILPLLEAADGLDFSGLGQDLGNAIAFGLTVITSGNLGNILSAQLKLSGAQFINTLMQGMTGIVAFLAQRMIDIPADFATLMSIVTKPEFWAGVGNGLLGAAQKFAALINNAAAALLEAISKVPGMGGAAGMAQGFRDTASGLNQAADQNIGQAGDALLGPIEQARAQLSQSFDNAINAAAIAMEAVGETIDTTELQAARDGLVGEITTQMDANRQAVRSRFEATKTQTPLMEDMEDSAGKGKGNAGVIAQSLQSVGGGAAFARFSDAANPAAEAVREQKKSNAYLETIAAGINYIRSGNGNLMPA
jgi:hypothetical protein